MTTLTLVKGGRAEAERPAAPAAAPPEAVFAPAAPPSESPFLARPAAPPLQVWSDGTVKRTQGLASHAGSLGAEVAPVSAAPAALGDAAPAPVQQPAPAPTAPARRPNRVGVWVFRLLLAALAPLAVPLGVLMFLVIAGTLKYLKWSEDQQLRKAMLKGPLIRFPAAAQQAQEPPHAKRRQPKSRRKPRR